MGTKKKRIKIALSEETILKLQCDSLERIIDNEYVIRQAFRDN